MEEKLKGTILYGDDFEAVDGYITIENGIIKDIEEGAIKSDTIIAPCFVNAHTHIGDSVLKDPPFLPLPELVQPPHGLKHRILAKTGYPDLVNSMRASIEDMIKTGTCAFSDFREGGIDGVKALNDALSSSNIHAQIFGRPSNNDMDYLEMTLTWYDSSGAIIEKDPLVWNINNVKFGQTLKVDGSSYISDKGTPAKVDVLIFDSALSDGDESSAIYKDTLTV